MKPRASSSGRGRQGRGAETDFPKRCNWPRKFLPSGEVTSLATFPRALGAHSFLGTSETKAAGRGEGGGW